MTSLELYNFLRDAWDRSAPADNAFIRALESTRWDDTFYADGEHCFAKGDAVFTTPVLDPFVDRGGVSPSMVTDDSSILYFYD